MKQPATICSSNHSIKRAKCKPPVISCYGSEMIDLKDSTNEMTLAHSLPSINKSSKSSPANQVDFALHQPMKTANITGSARQPQRREATLQTDHTAIKSKTASRAKLFSANISSAAAMNILSQQPRCFVKLQNHITSPHYDRPQEKMAALIDEQVEMEAKIFKHGKNLTKAQRYIDQIRGQIGQCGPFVKGIDHPKETQFMLSNSSHLNLNVMAEVDHELNTCEDPNEACNDITPLIFNQTEASKWLEFPPLDTPGSTYPQIRPPDKSMPKFDAESTIAEKNRNQNCNEETNSMNPTVSRVPVRFSENMTEFYAENINSEHKQDDTSAIADMGSPKGAYKPHVEKHSSFYQHPLDKHTMNIIDMVNPTTVFVKSMSAVSSEQVTQQFPQLQEQLGLLYRSRMAWLLQPSPAAADGKPRAKDKVMHQTSQNIRNIFLQAHQVKLPKPIKQQHAGHQQATQSVITSMSSSSSGSSIASLVTKLSGISRPSVTSTAGAPTKTGAAAGSAKADAAAKTSAYAKAGGLGDGGGAALRKAGGSPVTDTLSRAGAAGASPVVATSRTNLTPIVPLSPMAAEAITELFEMRLPIPSIEIMKFAEEENSSTELQVVDDSILSSTELLAKDYDPYSGPLNLNWFRCSLPGKQCRQGIMSQTVKIRIGHQGPQSQKPQHPLQPNHPPQPNQPHQPQDGEQLQEQLDSKQLLELQEPHEPHDSQHVHDTHQAHDSQKPLHLPKPQQPQQPKQPKQPQQPRQPPQQPKQPKQPQQPQKQPKQPKQHH